MSDGWRILDLTETRGVVDAAPGAVSITRDDGTAQVFPAAEISIILLGTGFSLTSGALHRLAAHDIVMILCDWSGVPQSVTMPWAEHSRIAGRQISQAKADRQLLDEVWQKIVVAKLQGQAATLRTVKPRFAPQLERIADQVLPGDETNCEGIGAAYYWKRLRGNAFRRDKNGGDRFNELLNYGYGILRGHTIQGILAAGLVGTLGIGHSNRSNPFNLASDLMEPYRPAIDYAVVHLPPYSSLRKKETKGLLAASCTQQFEGSGHSVVSSVAALARQYGRLVEGSIDEFVVPTWQGPLMAGTSTDAQGETAFDSGDSRSRHFADGDVQ